MKLSKIHWALLAVLSYGLFLLAYLPAAQVLKASTLPKSVSLNGVSGTIWHGKAQQLMVNGLAIDQLSWDLSTLSLLIGKVSLHIDGGNSRDANAIAIRGNIATSLTNQQKLSADELQLFVPTNSIVAQLPLPVPVIAEGRVKLNIDKARFNQHCQSLVGTGQWLNASVGSNDGMVNLGNFNAKLGCENEKTLVDIQAPNMLGLTARASIDAKLKYSVEGRFKPDASLPKTVKDAAVIFGKKDAEGFYQIKL